MKHFTSSRFWQCFERLPNEIQLLARRNFELIKAEPSHPSLQFKHVGNGRYRSARVGLSYRVLGVPVEDGVLWFWIGSHAEYDKILG